MPLGLVAYRGAASLAGAAAPLLRRLGGRDSVWRSAWSGASEDLQQAAGSVWVHAASMGEVVAARTWIGTLLGAGHRAPILLTTRTSRGLARARRELGDRVIARVAPLDVPQLLRSFLKSSTPWRLDVIETELWPHLILEARRSGVAVVFLSATVSDRTQGRLRRWGLAGPGLFGEGVWVLAQSERHAERFRSLGVPASRIEVTGDLKAEPPTRNSDRNPAERPGVVFGSLRPGEEGVAVALARQGGRALVLAPRHQDGFTRVSRALEQAGVRFTARMEADRSAMPVEDWISGLTGVGILFTQGELPAAYESAALAIVGGTFAPYGGHNALEPAARGCAVVVGPHVESIEENVLALEAQKAVRRTSSSAEGVEVIRSLLEDREALRDMGRGAVRAAALASDSARRSLEALGRFGLTP